MIIQAYNPETGQPVKIQASQLVVMGDRGTPIMVGGEQGPNAFRLAHVGDDDFEEVLRLFGHDRHHLEVAQVTADEK
jgi:hypothetical protein